MSYQAQAGFPAQGGEPPLDHPWYGIGFVDAIKRGFKKYTAFNGRASRGEYWWWVLFTAVIGFVLYGLAFGIGFATIKPNGQMGGGAIPFFILLGLFWLGVVVPSIAVAVRRLHDAGYSGWFYLLALIPTVGGIILLVLCVMQTSPQAPKYGPPIPPGWQPDMPAGYQQIGYAQQPGYPQQGGYAAPPAQGGYAQPPAQGGYAPPAQGGYTPPPAQGGYTPPPAQGGYTPPAQGGYTPPPAQGGYTPTPPPQTGYQPGGSDQQPGSANPPQN